MLGKSLEHSPLTRQCGDTSQVRWKVYIQHTISAILPSIYQNLLKMMEIWRSSNTKQKFSFLRHGVYSRCSVYICKSFWIVKLNLLCLCSEKTIKLFIHEITEYQLSLDLLYDSLFHRVFFCKPNGIQFTEYRYSLSTCMPNTLQQLKNFFRTSSEICRKLTRLNNITYANRN